MIRQKLNIKTKDLVKITTGKDRGKTGVIERTLPKIGKVIVAGTNYAKRHLRPTNRYVTGGIVTKSMPIAIANIQLICPHCHAPSRLGRKVIGNMRIRMCKKCHQNVDDNAQK